MIIKPQGMLDFFPEDTEKIQYIESTARSVAERFGFGEIRTPVLESTELFSRGVGNTTDVVQKEMYTFNDRDGQSYSLKPEGTAGVVRAILESGKYGDAMPLKYYYITNCYRHEKPQKGRYREFSQFGVEMFGSQSPVADATVISMADMIIKSLNIGKVELRINSIGCPKCRPNYHKLLREYFEDKKDALCATCRSRLETNPMRILDCKSEECKKVSANAPKSIDCLCEECKTHFETLKGYLEASGIKYETDTSIVRGLDYYTKTVFEFVCSDENMGSQSTICGGGRYDGLVEELGGNYLPACGFGMGITRLLPTVKLPEKKNGAKLYIATMGQKATATAVSAVGKLREIGIHAENDTVGRSLKAQMKYADKISAEYVIILGDNEIESGKATMKRMSDSTQSEIEIDKITEIIKTL
ncbi:MAG: histidine--tRNA ligase [Clostridia bacterium]|nr:histidine--tRNA ligase [Clostridia bacterium]